MTGHRRAAREIGPGRTPFGRSAELAEEGRAEDAGIVGGQSDADVRAKHAEERVFRATLDRARREVRGRAHVADDAEARERPEKSRILGGPDSVGDALRPEEAEDVRDGFGPRPLSRVCDGKEAGPYAAPVDVPEVARGKRRLVSAEAEADDARPGTRGVEAEDPLGGGRSPVPYEVEKNAHPPSGPRLVREEHALQGLAHVEPVEADLLDDGRRHVDLGPAHVLPREAKDEASGEKRVVGGAPELAADVPIETEERFGRSEESAARAHGSQIGEDGLGTAAREADESRRREGSFEVQVELGFRRGREAMKEGLGVSSRGHGGASYERPFETGPVPLGTPPRERLWLRVAAFGLDLALVAGVPLLLASGIVALVHALSRAPAGLDAGFRAAQAVAVVLFLARDMDGGSPGKRLFGLRVIRSGGGRAGFSQSVIRNVLWLVPGWNLIECASLISRKDGRRPGDRLAGTALVEA